MDGVILMAILVPAVIGLFSFIISLQTGHSGTKGIKQQPFVTKNGVTHTARKSREQHIV